MPKLIRQSVYYEDGSIEETYPVRQYWMHKEDRQILGRLRDCATPEGASPNTKGCPAVWVLYDGNNMVLNKYWQFALCGWNYKIPPKSVMAELGYTRALANGTGYGKPGVNRTNYPVGSNLDADLDPAFDKDRTFSRSMLSGVEVPNGQMIFRDYQAGENTTQRKTYTGYLILEIMDGTLNPLLKPGKRQPETMVEVNFEDYLYNPRDHPHLFFALNIVNFEGKLSQFAGGATYDWFFDGKHPVCFMPHVSRHKIVYPTELLQKLPLGTKRVNPYTNI